MMMFSAKAVAAFAACFSTLVARAQAGDVYAHFIVGNAGSYTQADWSKDVAAAADSKIDGFALNIGGDAYTDTQLGYAYAAAEQHGNFKMFISFDYAANAGFSADQVTSMINKYKTSSAQAQYQSKPIVSTFEGPGKAGDWTGIKSNTGCFFIPDWSSAKGNPGTFSVADGALSWDIWSTGDMTDSNDKAWQSLLGNKAYMMGISPWFYTDLPQYNKNWVYRGSNLWYDRWQQALEVQPQLIEIVTWNDFGESHYIGPIVASEVVNGAQRYVSNNPHDGWRALLPYYIEAYKSGNKTSPVQKDILSWAHQPNPVGSCSDGGVQGGQGSPVPANQVVENNIDVDMLLTAPAQLSVQIGSGKATTQQAAAGLNHFSIPFNGQTGKVTYTLSRNGQTAMTVQGAEISTDCPGGIVNFNAITGSSLDGSSPASAVGSGSSSGNNNSSDSSSQSSNATSASSPSSSGSSSSSSSPSSGSGASSPVASTPVSSPSSAPSSAPSGSGSSSSSSSSSGGSCQIEFDAKDVTQYGEQVFVTGNTPSLGGWDQSKGVGLSADQYTAQNPLWSGKASVPAGTALQYRYYTKATDGSLHWEAGGNRNLNVPQSCNGVVKQQDTVS